MLNCNLAPYAHTVQDLHVACIFKFNICFRGSGEIMRQFCLLCGAYNHSHTTNEGLIQVWVEIDCYCYCYLYYHCYYCLAIYHHAEVKILRRPTLSLCLQAVLYDSRLTQPAVIHLSKLVILPASTVTHGWRLLRQSNIQRVSVVGRPASDQHI